MTNPVAKLAASETALTQNIHRVADVVDQIGTGKLPEAVARLEASTHAAIARLQGSQEYVAHLVGQLLQSMDGMSVEIAVEVSVVGAATPLPPEISYAGDYKAEETHPVNRIADLPGQEEPDTPSGIPEPSTNGRHASRKAKKTR